MQCPVNPDKHIPYYSKFLINEHKKKSYHLKEKKMQSPNKQNMFAFTEIGYE